MTEMVPSNQRAEGFFWRQFLRTLGGWPIFVIGGAVVTLIVAPYLGMSPRELGLWVMAAGSIWYATELFGFLTALLAYRPRTVPLLTYVDEDPGIVVLFLILCGLLALSLWNPVAAWLNGQWP